MKKRNGRNAKRRSAHDDFELPSELDFSKLRYVGRGLGALQRYAAEKDRTIVLDEDVAKVFTTARKANNALRTLLKQSSGSGRRQRKSA